MKYLLMFYLIIIENSGVAIDKVPIDKQDWLNQMYKLMPLEICKEKSIFRQCYSITTKKCNSIYYESFKICSSQLEAKIPKIIQNYDMSKKYGGELGSCISQEYFTIMESRNVRNPSCDHLFKEKQKTVNYFIIEFVIALVAILVLIVSVYYSRKVKNKILRITSIVLSSFLSMITIVIVTSIIDTRSADLLFNSSQYFGFLVFVYLIILSRKKTKKE